MPTPEEIRLTRALMSPMSQQGQERVQERLSHMIRYQGLDMVHPSNVANHQMLVVTFALTVASQWAEDMGMLQDIKPATVIRLAQHHDAHEADPLIGDIPASVKDKMTREQVIELKENEETVHRKMASDYYRLKPDSVEYEQYLKDKSDLDNLATIEAESVKIGDTLHAIWETLHECLAGNESFYQVLQRYKIASSKLTERSSLWKKIQAHPAIQLDESRFPTPEKVSTMPLITKEQVSVVNAEKPETWYAFMREIHSKEYPTWYKSGFDLTQLSFGVDGTARAIFPKWRSSFYKE